ncbi:MULTISPECIES: DLW-39 family protein [unclassified Janibacter]|uniref:DLW-39 family protein n=1 Tax=unclassified Janibacter TaxID=2649294 RepID=UPI003D041EF9
MKKALLVIATALGASVLRKKMQKQQSEKDLWSAATDTSKGATPTAAGSTGGAWSSATDKV